MVKPLGDAAVPARKVGRSATHVSRLESEVIAFFVLLAKVFELPKSTAEIYGLLFLSPQPLPMDGLIAKLGLSKGAASQGIRFLKSLSAVKAVYVPGHRKDFFVAELEMKKLIFGLVREKVEPNLARSREQMGRIQAAFAALALEEQSVVATKIEKLYQWQKGGRDLLPLIERALS
jgi:DNA-binding transcriptional regulator GbsR (MarR family)